MASALWMSMQRRPGETKRATTTDATSECTAYLSERQCIQLWQGRGRFVAGLPQPGALSTRLH